MTEPHAHRPTLYATALSANGRKVLAVARHLGVDVRVERVNVYAGEGRAPAFLAIHPAGRIPVLVESDFVLTESNAIVQYLAETHGAGRLWASDPRGRADIARWMHWESSRWQPVLAQLLAPLVGRLVVPALAATPEVNVRWEDAPFRAAATLLDGHLRGRRYLVGDGLTLADFCVAGMMTYADAAQFPFAALPGIAAWYERVASLPAWRATAEGPWT
jgi:glutathione S-transferase